MELNVGLKLFFALVLGSVIGLERESYEQRTDKSPHSGIGSLGVRSFSLITTLGAIAGLLFDSHYSLYLLISITFMTLLLAYYIIGSFFTKDNGITTELAIIFSFLIGVFIALETFPIQFIIAMVVILVGILSIKEQLKMFISGIKDHELSAFLSFAIISLVIFPFLPNKSYSLSDIPAVSSFLISFGFNLDKVMNLNLFNPFNIWRVVVIITGIDILGYILEKTIGQKKGWLFTSLAGGFISSTSTTQSLAVKSRSSKDTYRLMAGAIFSNFSSFIQQAILIATISSMFFIQSALYLISILFTSLAIGIYFFNKEKRSQDENLEETKERLKQDKIFSLGPALKFTAIFLIVTIVTKLSLVFFGDSGFLITATIASVTGLDATTINVSQLAGENISYFTAVLALIISNAVNLFSKSIYAFSQGSREFARNFFISISIIIIFSLFGLIIFI